MSNQTQNRSIKKGLLSDAIIYGFTRYLSLFATIILTPIYTRTLTKTEYGVQDVFVKWIDLFLMVIPLGLYSAIQRYYPWVRDSETEREDLMGTTLISILCSTTFFAILIQLTRSFFIDTFVGLHEQFVYETFTLFNIMLFTRPIVDYLLQISRVQFKAVQYAIIASASFVLLTTLGFGLVYWLGWGIKGFFVAGICGNMLAIVIGVWLNKNMLSLHFNFAKSKEYIIYSLPFVISGLVLQLSEVIGRWQIKQAFTDEGISMAMVGTYSIGNRISGFLLLLVNVFQLAWVPYLFNISKQLNAKVVYANMLKLYMISFGTVLIGIVLFRNELIAFFAPAYKQTYHQIAILLTAVFLKSLQYVSTPGLILEKSSKQIVVAAFPSVAVNVVAGAILVRLIGLEGIAIGSLLGSIVWVAYTTYYSQKKYKVPFDVVFIFRFTAYLLSMMALAYLFDYLLPSISVLSFLLKSVWVLCCSISAFLYIRKRLWLGSISLE